MLTSSNMRLSPKHIVYQSDHEMSKVETQTSDLKNGDAKKLALRCKTLEVQLRQSISKKDHHDVTSKLEHQIDILERDLDRARSENQKTVAVTKQIAELEDLISSLMKVANAQAKLLDSVDEETTASGKALNAQGKLIDTIAAKIAQGTVPSQVHLHSLSKIRELEEEKRGMVRRFEYNSLEQRFQELTKQMGTMVPASEFAALKEKFDDATRQMATMIPASDYSALQQRVGELEGAISSMVSREQLASSEARVAELESRLAEHVPQSVYDELVSKVVSLAEAVTGGDLRPDETNAEVQQEVSEPEAPAQVATAPEPAAVVVEEPVAIQEPVAVEEPVVEVQPVAAVEEPSPQVEVPVPPSPVTPEGPTPEIREIQSQLAEITSQAVEAKGDDVVAPAVVQAVEPEAPAVSAAVPATEVRVSSAPEPVESVEPVEAVASVATEAVKPAVTAPTSTEAEKPIPITVTATGDQVIVQVAARAAEIASSVDSGSSDDAV
jgi:hypothetical protein